MKRILNWILVIVGIAAAVACIFMVVQAAVFQEYGRFVFYSTAAVIGGALAFVGFFRLKSPENT